MISRSLSSAILRANGEIKIRSRCSGFASFSVSFLSDCSSFEEACCSSEVVSLSLFSWVVSSESSSSLPTSSPSSPMIPSTAFTFASSPACTLIFNNVPLAGASTSFVNFSELIVTMLSPSSTVSPSDLNHSSTVPSFIVIPSFGIIIFSLIVIHLPTP